MFNHNSALGDHHQYLSWETRYSFSPPWKLIHKSINTTVIYEWWFFFRGSYFIIYIFSPPHPSLTENGPGKYSIKTPGLHFSFITPGLICNWRFVCCHFQATLWWLRNYSPPLPQSPISHLPCSQEKRPSSLPVKLMWSPSSGRSLYLTLYALFYMSELANFGGVIRLLLVVNMNTCSSSSS